MLDIEARLDPYLPGLKLYCRSLAGNDWDAEDLIQDVLMKTMLAIRQLPERSISRSYIFRIAKNAWIDHCRAERKRRGDTIFDEELYQQVPLARDEFLDRELLEQLAESVNPRQMVLIILIDALAFSASESAKLLHMTEGAVKEGIKKGTPTATLHYGRERKRHRSNWEAKEASQW